MDSIRPYKVKVSDDEISRLHERLSRSTFPPELDDASWDLGTPLKEVRRIAEHWRTTFDSRAYVTKINNLPSYMASIDVEGFDTVDIHFLHFRSGKSNAIPLLFLHGWPGSLMEVTKISSLLNQGSVTFDIIAPSYPNYGFSSRVEKRGFGLAQYAEVCHNLMLTLGYNQYVAQGGDWGSVISRVMAKAYPDHLKAIHLNLISSSPPANISSDSYTPADLAGLERSQTVAKEGMGYFHIQTTRPQTLAYFFADSPVGLLAWILDKLHAWSDDYPWTDDEVCSWVSMYWFSKAGPVASLMMYYECMRGAFKEFMAPGAATYLRDTKLGLAYFPKEFTRLPKAWGSSMGDSVVFEREHESGGHFAIWERPEAVAEDLQIMFGKGGGAFGVVANCNGSIE